MPAVTNADRSTGAPVVVVAAGTVVVVVGAMVVEVVVVVVVAGVAGHFAVSTWITWPTRTLPELSPVAANENAVAAALVEVPQNLRTITAHDVSPVCTV